VNDPNEDLTAQDTQSETTLVAFGTTVAAAYNDSFLGLAHKFTGYSQSADGGASFVDRGSLPTNPFGDAGDPSMARDNASGRIYLSTI
jgi:hypothetical protein